MAIIKQSSPGQAQGASFTNTIGKAIKSGAGSARAESGETKNSKEQSSNLSYTPDAVQGNEATSFVSSSRLSEELYLKRSISSFNSTGFPAVAGGAAGGGAVGGAGASVGVGGSSGGGGGSSSGGGGSAGGSSAAASGGGGEATEAWASAGASRSASASDLTANVSLQERQLPSGPVETFNDIPGEINESYKAAYEKLAASLKVASFDGNVRTGEQPSMSNSIAPLDAFAYSRSGGEVVDLKYMKDFSSKPEQIIGAFAEMTHGNEQLVDAISKTGLKAAIVNDVTDCYAYYMNNNSGHNGNPMMVLARSDNGLRTGTHEFTHHLDAIDGRIDGKFSIANLPDFDKNMAISIARVRDTSNNVVGGMSLNYAETFSQRAGVKGTSKETSEYLAEFMSYYALDSNKFRQSFPELAKDFDKFLGAHGEEAVDIDESKIRMKQREPVA